MGVISASVGVRDWRWVAAKAANEREWAGAADCTEGTRLRTLAQARRANMMAVVIVVVIKLTKEVSGDIEKQNRGWTSVPCG